MKVILFGASGMVGQGVLRECLLDDGVEQVLAVGRSSVGQTDRKLVEIMHGDLFDLAGIEGQLAGFDACFFCLGVSSAGMKEAEYERVTYGMTMAVAKVLVRVNPAMTFVYVSGQGTDSTEKGRTMWARVKGRTENALMQLGFKAAYMFRPGIIRPLHGIVSKTKLYRAIYAVMGPLYPVLKAVAPGSVTTTEAVGKAMLRVARDGASKVLLENKDINELAGV
jgi:uncharacterized protein YbjT (DUF2867 family)